MLEQFLKSEESEKLTKAQLKTVHGGESPEPDPEESRKGKVA